MPPAVAVAAKLTLATRRVRVIRRKTRSLRVACVLDEPLLDGCTITLKRRGRVLARAEATAQPDSARVTVTLPLDRRTRRLARRPGGLKATL